MSKLSAKAYWIKAFSEEPQTDDQRLAIAMMAEYARHYHAAAMAEVRKAVEAKIKNADHTINDFHAPSVLRQAAMAQRGTYQEVLSILDKHTKP